MKVIIKSKSSEKIRNKKCSICDKISVGALMQIKKEGVEYFYCNVCVFVQVILGACKERAKGNG